MGPQRAPVGHCLVKQRGFDLALGFLLEAKRRPETDAARVILWPISIRGLYLIYFNPISLIFSMIP